MTLWIPHKVAVRHACYARHKLLEFLSYISLYDTVGCRMYVIYFSLPKNASGCIGITDNNGQQRQREEITRILARIARTILTFRDIVGLEGRIVRYVVFVVVVAGNEVENDNKQARQRNQNETGSSAEAFGEAGPFYLPHHIVEIVPFFLREVLFGGHREIKDDSACFCESGRVFVEFAVSAIDLASKTSQLFVFRVLVLSCDIVRQDADIRPFAVHRSLRLLRTFHEEKRSSNGCRASPRITETRIAK